MKGAKVFSGSLPVENVQGLAAKGLEQVPDRYIRPELESDVVCLDQSRGIPVIDLSRLLDEQFSGDEMAKLHSACQDWGFFQLISHGASEEVIEKMKIDIQEFFSLPLEEKKRYSTLPNPNSIEGYGQSFVVSEEQKLDWADMLLLRPLPVHGRNMKFWPETPTSFRGTLDKYALELQKFAICLIGLMGKNLGVEPEKFTRMFENGSQGVRMNYYPPCPQADKVIGLSPHTDGAALTLLIQVNDVEGLQIRKNGNWVPVKPIRNAVIVNIGDALEIISNGKYKSIEHRGVVDPKKERLSIAAFHSPNFDTMIGPFPDLVKGNTEHYKTISYEEYIKLIFSNKLDGKNRLDILKLD